MVVMISDYRETTLVGIQTSAREMMKVTLNNRKIVNKINKNFPSQNDVYLKLNFPYKIKNQRNRT